MRASVPRSADSSQLSRAWRCTPPSPPVANTPIPAADRQPRRGRHRRRPVTAAGDHRREVADAALDDLVGQRDRLQRVVVEPHADLAADDRDGGRDGPRGPHRRLELAGHPEVVRARQSVADDRALEGHHGTPRGQRLAHLVVYAHGRATVPIGCRRPRIETTVFFTRRKTSLLEPARRALLGRDADPVPVPERRDVRRPRRLDAAVPRRASRRQSVGLGALGRRARVLEGARRLHHRGRPRRRRTPNLAYEEVCYLAHQPHRGVLASCAASRGAAEALLGEPRPARDAPGQRRRPYRRPSTHSASVRGAAASREAFQAQLAEAGDDEITTEIAAAGHFYYAEGYHRSAWPRPWYCGLEPRRATPRPASRRSAPPRPSMVRAPPRFVAPLTVPDDPKPPSSSRLGRTGRVGGLVAGQGLRWAGTRAANLVRSPERADAATGERAAALARELVEQLGQMRGAAMKIGQVLSTVEFTAIPESEREEFKRTLASLRDEVPPLPFKRMEKLLDEELGGPISEFFAEFEREAFAAASIGQVHRAVTRDGRRVAVKVQYPGVAEAVETDLRNLQVLLPLVKRLAPGPRRPRAGRRAARADRRGARLRDRGAEPPRHGARLARASVRARPAGRHRPLEPPRARHRAAGGQALRGGQAARRGRARPLRRDRVPLLLRHAQPAAARVRRPAPRQLPAARRRARRVPRLRADAGRRRRLPGGRAASSRGRRRRATPRPSTPASPRSATCPTRGSSSPSACSASC